MTENEIHKAVIQHLKTRAVPGAVWFHCPNDAKRTPGTYKRLQAMGLLAGVADLIILHNGEAFALELKAPKGRATEAQDEFLMRWINAGGYGFIAYGLDVALAVLKSWGIIK